MKAARVLSCLALIAVADAVARVAGLRRALRLFGGAPVGATSGLGADELVEHVALAAAFYPRRALCLEQSLALCWLLRRNGIAAELRLGVQPRPFQAHAWVEVDGRPLAERGDLPLNMVAFRTAGV